jgi:hypothetical protein
MTGEPQRCTANPEAAFTKWFIFVAAAAHAGTVTEIELSALTSNLDVSIIPGQIRHTPARHIEVRYACPGCPALRSELGVYMRQTYSPAA